MVLEQLVKFQKEYKELCDNNEELVAIERSHIHLRPYFFKSNFKEYSRGFAGSYLQLSTIHDGVEFIALISPDTERNLYLEELGKMPREGK